MDALRRTWQQIATLVAAMSPSQRLTLAAVPVVLLTAFGVLAWQDNRSSDVPLSWGKVFSIEELRSAEQTLIEAGLGEFRTEGQRILVPAAKVEQYNAALLSGGNFPSNAMSELQRQFEKASVFTSSQQLATHKEIALQNEMQKVLKALPDIEDATVIWARSQARAWPERGGKVTATVSLRPRRGRPLEQKIVRDVRAAVASMVPDLSPADVTVLDQSTGRAFTADRDGDPFDDAVVRWIEQHTEQYRRKIADALAYIPNVSVAVNVEVENLKSQSVREQRVDAKQTVTVEQEESTRNTTSTERASAAEPGAVPNVPRQLQTAAAPTRSSTNTESGNSSRVLPSYTMTEKEYLPAMPKAVAVSVSIPEGWYREIAVSRGFAEGTSDAEKATFRQQVDAIRKEEEEKARKSVLAMIPAGSPDTAVNVTSVTRIEPQVAETAIPWTEQMLQLLKAWGGTAGLGLLAVWGLWTLGRSAPKIVVHEQPAAAAGGLTAAGGAAPAAESEASDGPPLSKRDLLQGYVRDNPEAAAAVIGKWIQAAR